MLGLPGMLLAGSACRAQGSMDVWAAWAASPFEILGPEDAHGVLLYLHAEGLEDNPGVGADPEAVREAYGSNYDRLAGIKAQHDPANMFRMNQNIVPAG